MQPFTVKVDHTGSTAEDCTIIKQGRIKIKLGLEMPFFSRHSIKTDQKVEVP